MWAFPSPVVLLENTFARPNQQTIHPLIKMRLPWRVFAAMMTLITSYNVVISKLIEPEFKTTDETCDMKDVTCHMTDITCLMT